MSVCMYDMYMLVSINESGFCEDSKKYLSAICSQDAFRLGRGFELCERLGHPPPPLRMPTLEQCSGSCIVYIYIYVCVCVLCVLCVSVSVCVCVCVCVGIV